MKILTGDETGLVKLVDVEENKVQATMGEQQKDCAAQHVLKLRDVALLTSLMSHPY